MAFGEWLITARGDTTQQVLAERAGVSKGYITLLESNKRTPSVDVAIALARALGRSPQEALTAMADEQDTGAFLKMARVGDAKGGRSGLKIQPKVSKEELQDDELVALYFRHKKLSAKKRAEFKRILEMVDRELDRLEQEDKGS